MDESKMLIIGANGQLGIALREKYPTAKSTNTTQLDIINKDSVDNFDWGGIEVILNAAAYTNVDGAETTEGRLTAWKVNAVGVQNLVKVAIKNDITLVHVSSEYVFDGRQNPHTEDEPLSPLGVYGHTKAAGDLLVQLLPKHYLIRTSWVIGEGKNFVRTMLSLGEKGTEPNVVNDQIGRLTFTSELVRGIDHLLSNHVSYDTYNLTNEGNPVSWADITREIFKSANYDLKVTNTTTAEYFANKEGVAPRPLNSTLSLDKIHKTGFTSSDWRDDLKNYIEKEKNA